MDNNTELLTITEAANVAGVSMHTLIRWIDKHGLVCSRFGRFRLIKRGDLEIFLEASTSWRRESTTIGKRQVRFA